MDIWHGHLEFSHADFSASQDQMNVLVRIDCYLGALQFGLPWMFIPWMDVFFVFRVVNNIKQHMGGFPKMVGFPNKPMGFSY